MNQRMYINYNATIYFLNSIYADNLDINLKTAIKKMVEYLQVEVDKYVIPSQDNTLKNFQVTALNYEELLVKSKQVMALLSIMGKDKDIQVYSAELLEYIKILYKENRRNELMEERK